MHTVLYLSLYIIHSLICWSHDILVGLMTIILNQTTRGQTLWRNVHLETDITTCSHIAEIDNSAFSDACKSYHFSAICLRKSQSHG